MFSSYADYLIRKPLEVMGGGQLPDGSINFITDSTTPETPTAPDNTAGCVEFDYQDTISDWQIYNNGLSELYLGDYTYPNGIDSDMDSIGRHSFTTSSGISGYLTKGAFVERYNPAVGTYYIDHYKLVMCSDKINELKSFCGDAGHWNANDFCPRDFSSHSL